MTASIPERPAEGRDSLSPRRALRCVAFAAASLLVTLIVSATLVFLIELIVRGSLEQTLQFFEQPFRPSWTTVALFSLVLIALDALFGRRHNGVLLVAPLALVVAFVGYQKSLYLGDPLYPTDFLYSRQIVELMPLLVRERPLTAVAMVAGAVVGIALLVLLWRFWRRRFAAIPGRWRLARLAVALPALAFFVSIMDYATFSWTRDRLQIIPMMWDQKENYNSNGFALAFALNVPMAKVSAPKAYSDEAIEAIQAPLAAAKMPAEKPDVIIVMSESFWDPSRLPGVTIAPDPLANVRAVQSGHMFSPEFGGMTANVEFEALTGFSNAFLPYGSIPYQQYVRGKTPSLATFLGSEGYATRAIHPFEGWFWNRSPVYDSFGFDRFMSAETLPKLGQRGLLVSDEALTGEIIREAESIDQPFFLFAVSLQSHGPYEPGRYDDTTLDVTAPRVSEWARGSILTFAEGMADADRSLQQLIDWAKTRDRHTVIAFFGDHLPPLGPVYTETGFLPEPVAPRKGPFAEMAQNRETPLVVWSNRTGPVEDLGSISPAFIPLHVMRAAGIEHPYYTGFLGAVHDGYDIIDRSLVVAPDGAETRDWSRAETVDPRLENFRLLQYDMMFGKKLGAQRFFPESVRDKAAGEV